MKNISTGTGLAIVAAAALAYPFISSLAPNANASAVTAAVAAATAQVPPEPTIIWYGTVENYVGGFNSSHALYRAWSDGKVEMRRVAPFGANTSPDYPCFTQFLPCVSPWFVISDPNSGYNAAADINFDSKVDGSDLAQVLNDWGNAPRQDIPPSTCPLNLINP
ncbi:MAG: hypothetical protein NTZ05_17515 [Chloroflexi bacterium]|nr:hypothetical protein [Chloroflexota bacterium]